MPPRGRDPRPFFGGGTMTALATKFIETTADFTAAVSEIEAQPGYRQPAAFAVGIARYSGDPTSGGKVLDTYFPVVNCNENFGSAAVLAKLCGYTSGSKTVSLAAE